LYLERESGGVVGQDRTSGSKALIHELQVHQIELELQNEELRRTRAELEVLLDRYSDLYDFAPIGYFTVGRDGTLRETNLAGARLLGDERAQLVGRKLGAFVARSDRSAVEALIASTTTDGPRTTIEVTLAPAAAGAGEPVFVDLTVAAAPGAAECRIVAVDVSARRKAEEGLRASQKMEAVGRLAGGVAHDFNNLLGVVLSHAEFALESLPATDVARADLEVVKAVVLSATDLTRQLMTFSQGTRPRSEVLDLNELTTSVARMLGRLLGADVDLELALSADIGRVRADRSQLEQILVNLAVNAREAMPEGGRLTVRTASVELREPSGGRYIGASPGPYVSWSVTDTGRGIDDATLRRLFEPFVTTKVSGRGTGFGLSTVYGIVKQWHGDIAVHTRLGAGTKFEVFLPRVDEAVSDAPSAANVSLSRGGTETILVVEDEAALRNVVTRILERLGYTVVSAANGEQALKAMARHAGPIHLIVSDVRMPKMAGPELARRIRKINPDARVMFMSGFEGGDLASPETAKAQVLKKPFTTETLAAAVRGALDE